MKRNRKMFLLAISFVTLLFIGCGPIYTYDKIPNNVPKGYVEFYPGSEGRSSLSGSEIYTWVVWGERRYPLPWWDRQKRRYAEHPGIHQYTVALGNVKRPVTVEVIEGMITPIKVVLIEERNNRSYPYERWDFKLTVSVEKPIPFVPSQSNNK